MVIGLLVVMAVHAGIGDHSEHLMSSEVTAVAGMDSRSGMLDVEAHQTHGTDAAGESAPGDPANRDQRTGGMGMAMICQLLVLATIVGASVREAIVSRRRWSPGVLGLRLEASVRVAVCARRPPGLAVLCVARC